MLLSFNIGKRGLHLFLSLTNFLARLSIQLKQLRYPST